jgi:hypothetical protein
MNTSIRTRVLGATTLLAVLLGAAACGDATVADPGTAPGPQARVYPPVSVPAVPYDKPGRVSADTAERQAKAAQERHDRASTLRWARDGHVDGELKLRRWGRP